ncbi:hypothetical protein Efla_006128 [Eimeria flavescens]
MVPPPPAAARPCERRAQLHGSTLPLAASASAAAFTDDSRSRSCSGPQQLASSPPKRGRSHPQQKRRTELQLQQQQQHGQRHDSKVGAAAALAEPPAECQSHTQAQRDQEQKSTQPEQQDEQHQLQQLHQQQQGQHQDTLPSSSPLHSSAPPGVAESAAAAAAGGSTVATPEAGGGQQQLHAEFSCTDFDSASPYVPVGFLGAGAVGRVYHCLHRPTGERVAVKVVAKHRLRGRRRLQRQVLAEKEALVALSVGGRAVHPSIVHLRRTYQTSQNLYFVLQYSGAVTLRDVLTRLSCAGLCLSAGAARLWAAEAAAAVAALRLRGIVHRDIRPENLIVSEDGHLTLVDFDSAIRLSSSSSGSNQQQQQHRERRQQDTHTKRHERTRTKPLQRATISSLSSGSSCSSGGMCCFSSCSNRPRGSADASSAWPVLSPYAGTAVYAPPELFVSLDLKAEAAAEQQPRCGFGTDCWSLGCLVHELLLGEPPFKGDTPAALALAVCGTEQLLLPPQLPAAAADLISRLLHPRERDRLGAQDCEELLQHPFFEGLCCVSLHFQPLPADVLQYAFAFRGCSKARRAAAAAAAAEGRDAFYGYADEADCAGGDAEAATAAVTSAVMTAELTPSVGCRFSPLKTAACDASSACCLFCGCSRGCLCSASSQDVFPVAPTASCSGSSSGGEAALAGEGPPSSGLWWGRNSCSDEGNGSLLQESTFKPLQKEQHMLQQQHSGVSLQHPEATEEPQQTCRFAVTEAVLGWGPPLRLRPVSSAEYGEPAAATPLATADAAAAAAAAAAARGDPSTAEAAVAAAAAASAAAATGDAEDSPALSSGSHQLAAAEMTPVGLRAVSSYRELQPLEAVEPVAALGGFEPLGDDLQHTGRWLLKGETVRHQGFLFRMREHKSFCERLFERLFGAGHKRRNCQLHPQRCLALLTDAGRLLLLDPTGSTLRKTIHLATDGEIFTEGRDMLIYSSAEDGCYLLFASEGDTVAAWARSLAVSIDGLRYRAASGRAQSAGSSRGRSGGGRTELARRSTAADSKSAGSELHAEREGPEGSLEWQEAREEPDGAPQELAAEAGGPFTEGASVPTAATATAARMQRDSSSSSKNNNNSGSNISNNWRSRLADAPSGPRRGSLRLFPVKGAQGSHGSARRMQSR